MRVFVTGATGFVGSAVVRELLSVGHQVLGLARSDATASALASLGVQVQRGELADTGGLAAAARNCDGVIHTAFIHDFSNMKAAGAADLAAVQALGGALAGSGKPLIVTSGIGLLGETGRPATEDDTADPASAGSHRVPSEAATLAWAQQDVRAMLMRLPPSVHGASDHGFVPRLIAIARETGVSAYPDEGDNRWCAVHRLDAARLYRLALEQGKPGARYHAVAEEEVMMREIAAVIGRRLGLPVESRPAGHFGWLGRFAAMDRPASAAKTEHELGWRPMQAGLLADLDSPAYFPD
ncbi:SDR family oxidoreductase [Oxalobacteraceae bacterium A2-2]